MKQVAIVFSLMLIGCSNLEDVFGPSEKEVAAKCGISVKALQDAKREVGKMKPYSGRRIGLCDFIVDTDGGGHVSVITPEVSAEVDNMIRNDSEVNFRARP